MRLDESQRIVDPVHLREIRLSMEEEGIHKGEVIHGYIDVDDPDWDLDQADAVQLMDNIQRHNKLTGDGDIDVGWLPKGITIRISNGSHRLYAYCQYLADHWEELFPNPNTTLPEKEVKDKPFADGLVKGAGDILAQDIAYWLVIVEYIRK